MKKLIAFLTANPLVSLIALAAVSLPTRTHVSADVSWLTLMCERILNGETAYIDIFETTPPIPTLLYMPGVILSRWLNVGETAAVFATIYALIIALLAATARILPKRITNIGDPFWWIIAPAGFFVFFIVGDSFAQREHVAATLTLPLAAVFIARAEYGSWPDARSRAFAATCAGLAFAIKPPIFALPMLCLAAYEMLRTGSIRFVFSSGLIFSALVGVAVTVLSIVAFPAYLGEMLDFMRDLYVPARNGLHLLGRAPIMMVAIAMILAIFPYRKASPPPTIGYAVAISAGYFAAFVAQGKYFGYHFIPVALFALIALSATAADQWRNMRAESGISSKITALTVNCYMLATLGFLTVVSLQHSVARPDMSWAADYDRPTAAAISPDISTSFPLAQEIDATWVDRIHGQWAVLYARAMLAEGDLSDEAQKKYEGYYEGELARVIKVINERKPDVLFQSSQEKAAWLVEALLERDPALLDPYEIRAEGGSIRILTRRKSSATALLVEGRADD